MGRGPGLLSLKPPSVTVGLSPWLVHLLCLASVTFLLPMGLLFPFPAACGGLQAPDQGEEAIRELVAEIHARVGGLEVDGLETDWEGIPGQGEAPRGAGEDPSRDLIFASVVPTDTHLWVLLRTAGAPSRSDRAFWLNLDLGGDRRPELQIGLSSTGPHHVRLFEGYREGATFRSSAPVARVGEVVEVMIPLDSVASWLGGSGLGRGPSGSGGARAGGGPALSGPGARSWVRVFPLSWDAETGAFVDFGPAVASFRIRAEAYPLDPPLPQHPAPAATLPLPLEGQWWIAQGPLSYSSHAGVWAYDLAMVDHALQWASEPGSCDLENNYSWNRQIWSPVEGRVRGVVRSRPDGSPCVNGEGDPNSVYLDLGGGVGLWLAHFRQGSIVLDEGDPVGPGEYLGRVGNSGTSSGPHLHLGLYDTGDGSTTLSLALRDVRVGLNPGPDDPWARELAVWEPREGFFVNPLRSIRR